MAYSISSSVSKIGSSLRNNKRGRYGNNNNNNNKQQRKKPNSTLNDDNDDYENIKANYTKWCAQLKVELKQKSKINVDVRLEKMENIVNDVINSELQEERASNFYISDDDKKEMMKQIEDKIDSWRGVEIEVCRNKEKKNFEAYQATARNWFNRNKAKIYGNHLFYEIIYNHILKFCAEIEGITEEKRMTLFIDVFERILAEPVQFPRTKLQPLLPHQSLMQPNRFKKASEQFTMIYNTRWMLANNSANNSKRDRDRAKKIHTSFTNCLNQIKQQLQTQSTSNPPMPFPFESIMNDTGSTTTKSITSSTKSISIDYEINDSVANHSPFKSSRRQKSSRSQSHSHSHSSSSNNDGDFKLSMVDHSSTGSTQSTQSKDNDDTQINDFHQDTGYIDGYDEQYLDDEYMKELPPTVEMGGYQTHHMISRQYNNNRLRPFGNNPRMNNMIMNNMMVNNNNNNRNMNMSNHHRANPNAFINDNVIAHGIVTGNHLINDVIDEVVYDDNFKIEQTNNGYYDGTFTMNHGDYHQLDPVNNNLNINNHISNAYNMNNPQNYHNNNSNTSMLCIDADPSISSMQQNTNIATIQVQQPFIPQFPNNGNFVTLPTLNRPFPINNNNNNNIQHFDINDNQRSNIQRSVPMLRSQQSTNSSHSHTMSVNTMSVNTMNPGNVTPETALTGQSSSSSSDSSLSSSYAPTRGTNKSLNVSTKRYSPISTPTTPTTPRMRNRASNTSTNSSSSIPMNYNDYTIINNPRMIDSYQITPFQPSYDDQQPPQQQQQMMMDNNNNNNNIPPAMMNNDGNDNLVFTNLSNISSPTPLLGGFL